MPEWIEDTRTSSSKSTKQGKYELTSLKQLTQGLHGSVPNLLLYIIVVVLIFYGTADWT